MNSRDRKGKEGGVGAGVQWLINSLKITLY